MAALRKITESRWDLGEWRNGAVEDEPPGSAQTVTGLVGDDGRPYRRGGATFKSNAAVGAAGLYGVWSGNLVPGLRTVILNATTASQLAVDDTTPATVAATTLTGVHRVALAQPGVVTISDEFPPKLFAGSRKTAAYTTGTISVTNGGRTVTGTGTSWLANVDVGMILSVASQSEANVVKAVNSDTSLEVAGPWGSVTATGLAYSAAPTFSPFLEVAVNTATPRVFAGVAGRLVIAARQEVYFSEINRPFYFQTSTNFHRFPADAVGLGVLRDTLLVFTEAGMYAVSNMAYDLTDAIGNPQQRVELVNADLVAWGHNGIAPWRGALIVPCLDGVWLLDAISNPVRISDRIQDLYLGYVQAGYSAGVAEVFNGHYLLPILNGTTWVDTLVCKLSPSHSGAQYAWTQLDGFGAKARAFTERSSSPPVLLAASSEASSRVLNATPYLSPTAAVKNDADGTTHGFTFATRNIPTGDNGRRNAVRYIVGYYKLEDAGTDNPTITAEASADGGTYQTLAVTTGTTGTTAGEQDGTIPVYWQVNMAAERIRFRLTSTSPAQSLSPKRLEVYVRDSGRF